MILPDLKWIVKCDIMVAWVPVASDFRQTIASKVVQVKSFLHQKIRAKCQTGISKHAIFM